MTVSRKMDTLIRFFKQVVSDPKVSMRTRMQAATRLDDIYARHMVMQEKAEARKERALARATASQSPGEAIETQESDAQDETEKLNAVFGAILNGGSNNADSE